MPTGRARQTVDAFAVGDVRADEAGLRVLARDRDARDRRALVVDDPARDVAGRLLRECGPCAGRAHVTSTHSHASGAETLLMRIGFSCLRGTGRDARSVAKG